MWETAVKKTEEMCAVKFSDCHCIMPVVHSLCLPHSPLSGFVANYCLSTFCLLAVPFWRGPPFCLGVFTFCLVFRGQ